MRIKSYFDSSIQTAMRQARCELGDDVILVTSRIASSESRHLGDFEVVCSADEPQTAPKEGNPSEPPVAGDTPAANGFERIFRQQLPPAGFHSDCAREAGIAVIRSSLAGIGLEPPLTEALIALVRGCAPLHSVEPDNPPFANHPSLPVGSLEP